MFAVYLNSDLTLVTFLGRLDHPTSAEFFGPEYSNLEVSFDIFNEFQERFYNKKELIVFNGALQEMVYTTDVVRFIDGTYDKIDRYDFRREGIDYVKVLEDDANYIAFRRKQELERAREAKKAEFAEIWANKRIRIIKGVNQTIVKPTQETVIIFENGATFPSFPYFMVDQGGTELRLTTSNCNTIVFEVREEIQIISTSKIKCEFEIDSLYSIEEIENYQIRDYLGREVKMIRDIVLAS